MAFLRCGNPGWNVAGLWNGSEDPPSSRGQAMTLDMPRQVKLNSARSQVGRRHSFSP